MWAAPLLRAETPRSPSTSCDLHAEPFLLPLSPAALASRFHVSLSKIATAFSAHRKRLASSHARSAPVLHGPCGLATSQYCNLSAAPRFPRFSLLLPSRSRLFQSRRLHLTGPSTSCPASYATKASSPSTRNHTLLGFDAPSTPSMNPSDLHRGYLSRLCCAFRLSQPLDALFRDSPLGPISCRKHPWGFSLQRFPPSCSLLRLTARPALFTLVSHAPLDSPTWSVSQERLASPTVSRCVWLGP